MSSRDIYLILRRNPDKVYTVRDLSKVLGIRCNSVCKNLEGLRRFKELWFGRNEYNGILVKYIPRYEK